MADALFAGTQQRVLALLFGRPDRSFYTNEVVSAVAGGKGVVQRELEKLARSELVTVQTSGNQKHYQANRDAPIFAELHGIVQKTLGLAEPLRNALGPFADRIAAAFVFGSVAKRSDGANSDIDLFVLSEDLGYADLFEALEKAQQSLGRVVNPTLYTRADLARRLKRGDSFATRVKEQPKVWLIGDEHALSA